VIPENVRHGEELICSYFACRNAGVKFRYCSHCKVPVAKRNFRKRHKHGDNLGKDGGDDEDHSGTEEDGCSDEGELPDMSSQGAVPSQVTTGRSRKEAIPSQVTTTTDERASKKNRSEDVSKKSHIPSQVTTSIGTKKDVSSKKSVESKKSNGDKSATGASESNSVCMRSGDDRSKVIESRRKRWAYLLEKRPQTKDGEAMSSWLMQVLAVSDLWKPLNESEKMPNASLDLIRECAQAGNEKKERPAVATTSGGATNDSGGSSDSQDTNNQDDNSENQDGNNAENSSNDSDNQETETDGRGTTDEDRAPGKKKSMVLKKRPVLTTKDGQGDNNEPPTSKAKL